MYSHYCEREYMERPKLVWTAEVFELVSGLPIILPVYYYNRKLGDYSACIICILVAAVYIYDCYNNGDCINLQA